VLGEQMIAATATPNPSRGTTGDADAETGAGAVGRRSPTSRPRRRDDVPKTCAPHHAAEPADRPAQRECRRWARGEGSGLSGSRDSALRQRRRCAATAMPGPTPWIKPTRCAGGGRGLTLEKGLHHRRGRPTGTVTCPGGHARVMSRNGGDLRQGLRRLPTPIPLLHHRQRRPVLTSPRTRTCCAPPARPSARKPTVQTGIHPLDDRADHRLDRPPERT